MLRLEVLGTIRYIFYDCVDKLVDYLGFVEFTVVGKKKEKINGKYAYFIEAESHDKKYKKFFSVKDSEEYKSYSNGDLYKYMSVVKASWFGGVKFVDTPDIERAKLMLLMEYSVYLGVVLLLLWCLLYIITSFIF